MTRFDRARRWLVGVCVALGAVACTDEVVPTEVVEPTFIDPTRLLDDGELRTPEDPNAPQERPAWVSWIEANHQPIRSVAAEDFSDLDFLDGLVGDKRIVQLGESGHGVREFSQLKVRFIKYLHEKLGFNVVALESSVYECFIADRQVTEMAPIGILDRCAFLVWRSEEVLELFRYIEETRSTANPLRLVGIDTQVSSPVGASGRPAFFHNLVDLIDPVYADTVGAIDQQFLDRHRNVLAGQHVYLLGNRDWLIPAYERLANFFEDNLAQYAAPGPEAEREALIAAQTARSTVAFIKQLTTESNASIEHRDLGMSDNLTFVSDRLYPDEKVVVWAHNFHIRHANHEITPVPAPFTMGHWQRDRLGDDMYTIGLYMYSGMTAANDRTIYPIAQATSGSVESILYHTRRRWSFVDLRNAEVSGGTSWMDTPVTAYAWGVNPLLMTPRNQYDGIVFVHEVSPPQYLN